MGEGVIDKIWRIIALSPQPDSIAFECIVWYFIWTIWIDTISGTRHPFPRNAYAPTCFAFKTMLILRKLDAEDYRRGQSILRQYGTCQQEDDNQQRGSLQFHFPILWARE